MARTIFADTIQSPDNRPVNFPNGILIGTGSGAAGLVNNIGVPGQQGFGASPAPYIPAGWAALYGTNDPAADVYGNYQYSDGSIAMYKPSFYWKCGTGTNGLALNFFDVKPFSYFADVATANAAGYALSRGSYNAGGIRPGALMDKYLCSNNNGIASSIKNGVPLSSAVRGGVANTAFGSLNGAPANNFYGAIAAAKTRGAQFFPTSQFLQTDLAILANAHASASTGTAYNAWYDPAGIKNFVKGCNNNALGDCNDATIAYLNDGTGTNCGKTGSANFFARTTHNGQNCGIADINGLLWRIVPFGITSDGTNFYLLNTSVDVAAITAGNTLATDCWGATGLAAMYTNIGATYESLTASNGNKTFGSAAQVLSAATSGTAWAMAGAGVPLLAGVGGSNQFGNDFLYDARPNELCVMACAYWNSSSGAGPWARGFTYDRSDSASYYGLSSACYL